MTRSRRFGPWFYMTLDSIDLDTKIEIAKKFIVACPPNEISEVVNDLRVITGEDRFDNLALSAFDKYDCDNYIVVQLPETNSKVFIFHNKCIVSEYTKLEEGVFFDPKQKLKFHYDHLTGEVTSVSSVVDVHENENLRLSVEKVVDEYVNEHFPVAGSTVICKDDQIIVLISGMKFNKSSFLNSQWKSTVRISAKDLKIAGDTTIKVHYFEEGNVYLEVQDSFQTGKYQNATIDNFVCFLREALKEEDEKIQMKLNESFNKVNEETFKTLRRTLPLTKSKIEWSKIQAYKFGSDISSNK